VTAGPRAGDTASDGDFDGVAWKLLRETPVARDGLEPIAVVAVGGVVVGLMRDVVAIGKPWEGGGAGNGRRRPFPMLLSGAR
jgi:hypothetical protein